MEMQRSTVLIIVLLIISFISHEITVTTADRTIISETVHVDALTARHWLFSLSEGNHSVKIKIFCPYGDITLRVMDDGNFSLWEDWQTFWGWRKKDVIEATLDVVLTEGTWYIVLDNRDSLSSARVEISAIEVTSTPSHFLLEFIIALVVLIFAAILIIVISKRLKKSPLQEELPRKQFCSNCGGILHPETSFCDQCGNQL